MGLKYVKQPKYAIFKLCMFSLCVVYLNLCQDSSINSVDSFFSYSVSTGIFGFYRNHNRSENGDRGVRVIAHSINYN